MTTENQQPVSPKVYFRKVILTNPFFVAGQAVPFEPVPGNEGVIALDPKNDTNLITALRQAASEQVGGIVSINQAQYEEKKTQRGLMPSAGRPRETLRVVPRGPNPFNIPTTVPKAVAPANVEPTPPPAAPAPAPTPTPQEGQPQPPPFRPATRRISRRTEGQDSIIPAG